MFGFYSNFFHLTEPLPERPLEGPGAKVDISIPTECLGSVADFVNDSIGYPDTETLNDNAHRVDSVPDHNRDYYTKVPFFSKDMNGTAPKPPPRAQRIARKQNLQNRQQQQLQLQNQQPQINNEADTAEPVDGTKKNHGHEKGDVPNLQQNCHLSVSNTMSAHNIPELSDLLEFNSSNHSTAKSEELNRIPMLTLLDSNIANASGELKDAPIVASTSNAAATLSSEIGSGGSLPLITELNLSTNSSVALNGVGNNFSSNQLSRQITTPSPNALSDDSHCSSLSNDSFDDDGQNEYNGINMSDVGNVDAELDGNSGDQSLPCLSVFGRQSPGNDSSLTTVTCTSGDNSFEFSLNDSSSTSTTDPTAQWK
ncbi:PREDICTED: protein Tube-like [Rhagoletis zephyria]|uniref:protein Tube-like n=1 Tax=Rhagoletis zephyria TaxID=28612 RepID=UPI0008114FAF|nr:PREDICTED: protein Tube-like [Rhagoletis zephyria]